MAILAAVLLVHQPLYVLTQFLIARGRQRQRRGPRSSPLVANLVLSVVLPGRGASRASPSRRSSPTSSCFAWIVPRYAAPAAGTTRECAAVGDRTPGPAGGAVGAIVLVAIARVWQPDTLLALAPLGVLWVVTAIAAVWWFGFADDERRWLEIELRRGGVRSAAAVDV